MLLAHMLGGGTVLDVLTASAVAQLGAEGLQDPRIELANLHRAEHRPDVLADLSLVPMPGARGPARTVTRRYIRRPDGGSIPACTVTRSAPDGRLSTRPRRRCRPSP